MNRIYSFFTYLVVMGTLFAMAYSGYIALRPVEVLTYRQAIHPTDKGSYAAGEQLFVAVDVCKYGDYKAIVYPQLVGENIVPMPSFVSDVAPGCYNFDKVAFGFIPNHTPTGDYKLRWLVEYKINALRTETYVRETLIFHVIGKQAVYF